MKRFYTVMQSAAITIVLIAVLSGFAWLRLGDASVRKIILATRSCSQANVVEVIAGQVPGLPPGDWYPEEDCAAYPDMRCIDCEQTNPLARSEDGADCDDGIQVKSLKQNYPCGNMIIGHCKIENNVAICKKDDPPIARVCKDVSFYELQPIDP